LNSVASAVQAFTIAPSVQQKIENKIQESSAFLKQVNMVGVTEKSGQKLGLGTHPLPAPPIPRYKLARHAI
jgi:hypothetical protein